MSLVSATTSLFFVLNSLGNVPFFVGILSKYPPKRQRKIIFQEMVIALFILLLFNFFGEEILSVLGIDRYVMGIVGGTLLFLISLTMIFPKPTTLKVPQRDPFIFPLAMPAVAGPGAITTVMIYSQESSNPLWMVIPIFIAWSCTALVLLASSTIKMFLGQKGLIAFEKLGGMVISLIAVQMLTTGFIELLKNNLHS